MRYFIKKPRKDRRAFGLVAYKIDEGSGRRIYIDLPENLSSVLSVVNQAYLDGAITQDEAVIQLKEAIDGQLRRQGVREASIRGARLGEANYKALKAYWDDEYAGRFLEDDRAPYYKLEKALRLIEPLSIYTATKAELSAQLKKTCKDNGEIRRTCSALNQLLKYLGRDFRLSKPKPDPVKVEYVTEAELRALTDRFEDPRLVDFAWTLFGTGMRLSEAIAAQTSDLNKYMLMVDKQMDKNGKVKSPKRDRIGRVIVLDQTLEHVKRWLALPTEERHGLRYNLYTALERACFELNLGKRIGPHDLRHSHAIYLLERGASLTEVALQLRNTVQVCQRYYTGFEHTPGTLDRLHRLVQGGKNK